MKKLLLGAVALLGHCLSLHATTYYIANSGNDASQGTSSASPWRTIGKLNTALLLAEPGDSFLLKGGDIFRDDYVRCGAAILNPGSATISSVPPKCSGKSGAVITIGSYGTGAPALDAADPLTGMTWTRVSGTTWSAPLPEGYAVPVKLFVNSTTGETLPLISVPNCRGTYNSGTQYKFLDCVEQNGRWFTYGVAEPGLNDLGNYTGTYFPRVKADQQWFPSNQSPLQIVEEGTFAVTANTGFGYPTTYPGLWYTDGTTIWVNLASGADPHSVTFEGTHRPYGVVLEGVNYVTVTGLTIEHTALSGILSFPYTTANNSYFVGEYNTIRNNTVYNWGSLPAGDNTGQQSWNVGDLGGIVVRNDSAGHLVRGNLISANFIGLCDGWFDDIGGNKAGVVVDGIDGGGNANNPTLINNYIRTVTTQGVNWIRNLNGGLQAYNELTNNQGNDYFSNSHGGQLDHEFIHESYAEGIQIGGNVANSSALPQKISYNVIANIGVGADNGLFNGIDCNGSAVNAGIELYNNTIVNTWAAAATFEGTSGTASSGCQGVEFYNNILDQNANSYPSMTATNGSYDIYFVSVSKEAQAMHFHNNVYVRASIQPTVAQGNASKYASCSEFFSGWPDTKSSCPLSIDYVNAATDDFRLSSTSPARAMGVGGADIGAAPFGSEKIQAGLPARGSTTMIIENIH